MDWFQSYPIESLGPHPVASQSMARTPVRTAPHNLRDVVAFQITWSSCDDHTTTCHLHPLVGRSLSWWTWDLKVPTLFLFNLFLSYCMLMLLCLLHSGPTHTYSHSQLGGQLYALLYPVRIPIPFTSMQTATLLQIPFGLHPDGIC